MIEGLGQRRGSKTLVERDVIVTLLSELRERQPIVLHLGDVPVEDVVRVTRALGAKAVMRLPRGTDGPRIDVLVIAPGTVRAGRRKELEQVVAAARHWGVPTLIDASGAGSRVSRTAAIQRTAKLALWPVIRAGEDEAAALVSPAGSSKPSRRRRDLTRLASSLAQQGGIAVVTDDRAVITDGVRAFTVHAGHPGLDGHMDAGYLATTVLGAFLGAAHRADFLTAAVVGLECLGLAAEQAAKRARNRRALKPQLLRELAAITAEDLHRKMQPAAR